MRSLQLPIFAQQSLKTLQRDSLLPAFIKQPAVFNDVSNKPDRRFGDLDETTELIQRDFGERAIIIEKIGSEYALETQIVGARFNFIASSVLINPEMKRSRTLCWNTV